MGQFRDLTGTVFGRLTVLKRVEDDKWRNPRWLCRCSCEAATEKIVYGNALRSGATVSCGCYQRERVTTHGETDTPLFAIWQMMKQRCENPKHKSYKRYQGRGIAVCEEWSESYEAFRDYVSAELGERPSDDHSIDRIDNDRGYEPGNIRWATALEQGGNKANNRLLTKDGVTKTLSEWCRELGIAKSTILNRKERGWTDEEALDIRNHRNKDYVRVSTPAEPSKSTTNDSPLDSVNEEP